MLEGPLLRIVQPNLTQEERLNTKKRDEIVERMISLSSEPHQDGADPVLQKPPTHIIWPESSLPFLLTSFPQVLSRIKTMLQPGQVLIAGLSRAEDAGAGSKGKNIFNSIYTFGNDGKVIDRYDKIHLVPFGEYIPLENVLEAWGIKPLASLRSFSAGSQRQLMTTANAPPFAPLICYEIIFPGEVIQGGARPGWLVNLSDDSWFGRSLGPYQHLHQARVRAAEEGLPVVRSTSTGISAVIDPYGRILAKLPLNAQNVIDSKLPQALPPTHFSRESAKISFYFLAGFGLLAALLRRRSG
jgi:apolipoprotein N-acyltransferase